MADPLLLKLPPRDPRDALYQRLENAPREHAEALLATYDVLQGLHDKGVLGLLQGALGSGEKVLQILVDAGNTPEVIRGIRNLVILAKILDGLEPELLEGLERAVPAGLAEARNARPPGFWRLFRKLCSRDTRRALGASASILQALGKSLGAGKIVEP